MVAAWISAETGVGPSMASGSQVNNGNCADLPITPQNIQSDAAVCHDGAESEGRISLTLSEPAFDQTIIKPIRKPASPIRFMMKALRDALAACSRSMSCPMRM